MGSFSEADVARDSGGRFAPGSTGVTDVTLPGGVGPSTGDERVDAVVDYYRSACPDATFVRLANYDGGRIVVESVGDDSRNVYERLVSFGQHPDVTLPQSLAGGLAGSKDWYDEQPKVNRFGLVDVRLRDDAELSDDQRSAHESSTNRHRADRATICTLSQSVRTRHPDASSFTLSMEAGDGGWRLVRVDDSRGQFIEHAGSRDVPAHDPDPDATASLSTLDDVDISTSWWREHDDQPFGKTHTVVVDLTGRERTSSAR